jgi:5'-3' exonuclease
MRNYDLQIIWSSSTDYSILVSSHYMYISKRKETTVPLGDIVEKWFSQLEPEEKFSINFMHLN